MNGDDTDGRHAPSGEDAEPAAEGTEVTEVRDPAGEHTAVTVVQVPVDSSSGAEDAVAKAVRRKRRMRDLLVGALVFLACLALVLTGVAFWVHYTVLNTDRYVEIVAPIAKDPETLDALSDYVATEIITATDLETRTSEALPPRLSFLAAPITGAVETFITEQTYKVLSSDRAYELWLEINRQAHSRLVALLRGEATNAYIEGDQVKLNTLPLISEVLVLVDARLPQALSTRFDPPVILPETPPDEARQQISSWLGRPVKEDLGQITLLTSDALGPAQTAVKWLDRLVIVLPVLTLALAAAAVWLSRRRRRTIIELGIGVASALIVLYVVLNRLTITLNERLEQAGVLSVAQDVVAASVAPLTELALWVAVVGAVAAVLAWLAGRSAVRAVVVSAGNEAVRASTPVLSWSAAHADLLRVAGLVVGLILVVLFSWSWLWLVVWLILIGVYQLLVSRLAGEWPFAGDGGVPGPTV